MSEPHLREHPVYYGGLMRCCLATLDETPVLETEGEVLACKYCKSSMRHSDNAWRWAKDLYPQEKS